MSIPKKQMGISESECGCCIDRGSQFLMHSEDGGVTETLSVYLANYLMAEAYMRIVLLEEIS